MPRHRRRRGRFQRGGRIRQKGGALPLLAAIPAIIGAIKAGLAATGVGAVSALGAAGANALVNKIKGGRRRRRRRR